MDRAGTKLKIDAEALLAVEWKYCFARELRSPPDNRPVMWP